MRYEINVSYSFISEEIHADEISKVIGIIPTNKWQIGDKLYPKAILTSKTHGWELNSKYYGKEELEIQYNDISNIIKMHYEGFKKISSLCESELSIELFIYHNKLLIEEEHNTPALHFSKEIITLMADLNSEIDIDLYVLPDDYHSEQ